jgi:YgiT-type zinc finger domain-containing protein
MGRSIPAQEAIMRCVICRHGGTGPGHVTVTLDRAGTTVVVREVPALVCDNCGEYYLSSEVAAVVSALAEDAVRRGAEVEVLRYVA